VSNTQNKLNAVAKINQPIQVDIRIGLYWLNKVKEVNINGK